MANNMRSRSRRPAHALFAMIAVAALTLTACGESGSDDEGAATEGAGVDAGASKDEYIAALADMDPVTLTLQGGTGTSPGATESRMYEAYAEAIDEWSDGKITIDLQYGDALATRTELVDALNDGRLGVSVLYPLYEPDRYPVNSALFEATVLSGSSQIVGMLQTAAGMLEAAWETPAAFEEFEELGVKTLLPALAGQSVAVLCNEPGADLASLQGGQIRTLASFHGPQVEALGMAPVSVAAAEVYESLQRGTIDCSVSSIAGFNFTGWLEVADDIITDDGLGNLIFTFGVSQAAWDELPLAAQQLLHDRQDVLLEERLLTWTEETAEALKVVEESGGSVSELAADAGAEVNSVNADRLESGALDAAGEDFVPRVTEALDRWEKIVTDELGYSDEVSQEEFGSWYEENGLDLAPFIDRVRTDILDQHRPSN